MNNYFDYNIYTIIFNYLTLDDIQEDDLLYYTDDENIDLFNYIMKYIYKLDNKYMSIYTNNTLVDKKITKKIMHVIHDEVEELKNIDTHIDFLKFDYKFNKKIIKNIIPTSITKIIFGNDFNTEIDIDVLPNNLVYLEFGNNFNQQIKKGVLPDSLVHLKFGDKFCKSMENMPNNIKFLKLGDCQKDIKNIPDSVEKLILPNSFNKCLLGILPTNLIHLELGNLFEQDIKNGDLPETLEKLKFGSYYNKKINSLPLNLRYLEFGAYYNQKIDKNVLPNKLKHVVFGYRYNQIIDKDVLPNSLNILVFGYSFNQKLNKLPDNIEELIFGDRFNQKFEENILPNNIKKLELGYCYNNRFDKNVLPEGLLKLKFGYKQYISKHNPTTEFKTKNYFPDSLETLIFNNNFNTILNKGDIPNVKKLVFGHNFNKKLDKDVIPYGVKYLEFGNMYDKKINKNIIPESVTHLIFGINFENIDIDTIPNKVTHLILGYNGMHNITKEYIPKSVIYLKTSNLKLINENILYLSLYTNNEFSYNIVKNTNIKYIRLYYNRYIVNIK